MMEKTTDFSVLSALNGQVNGSRLVGKLGATYQFNQQNCNETGPELDAPPWDENDDDGTPTRSLTFQIDPVSHTLIRYLDGVPNSMDVEHARALAETLRGRLIAVPPTARVRQTFVAAQFDQLPRLDWLIEGLIPCRSVTIIFGTSGAGKSALVLDMGFATVSGRPFAGRLKVRQGPVLYCTLEGQEGTRNRALICMREQGLDTTEGLHFDFSALNIGADADIDDLAATALRLGVVLIIIDTLSASLAGELEENSNRDMAKMIAGLKRLVNMTGASVLVVHHTGHQDGRERGASALRRDVDGSISLTRKGAEVEWVAVKTKDGPEGTGGRFELAPIEGPDAYGEITQSIMVRHLGAIESAASTPSRGARLPEIQSVILQTLQEHLSAKTNAASPAGASASVSMDEAVALCLPKCLPALSAVESRHRTTRVRDSLKSLIKKGLLIDHDGRIALSA